MKVWFKIVLVLTLVALVGGVVVGCSGGGSSGGSGPEDTVRNVYKAMEAQDAAKVASYYTEDISRDKAAYMQSTFDVTESIEIKNLETSVASQSGNIAIVDCEYDITYKISGMTTRTEHNSKRFTLAKVDGKWLINSD